MYRVNYASRSRSAGENFRPGTSRTLCVSAPGNLEVNHPRVTFDYAAGSLTFSCSPVRARSIDLFPELNAVPPTENSLARGFYGWTSGKLGRSMALPGNVSISAVFCILYLAVPNARLEQYGELLCESDD